MRFFQEGLVLFVIEYKLPWSSITIWMGSKLEKLTLSGFSGEEAETRTTLFIPSTALLSILERNSNTLEWMRLCNVSSEEGEVSTNYLPKLKGPKLNSVSPSVHPFFAPTICSSLKTLELIIESQFQHNDPHASFQYLSTLLPARQASLTRLTFNCLNLSPTTFFFTFRTTGFIS